MRSSATTHQANDRVERLNKRPRALMNNTLKSTRGAGQLRARVSAREAADLEKKAIQRTEKFAP